MLPFACVQGNADHELRVLQKMCMRVLCQDHEDQEGAPQRYQLHQSVREISRISGICSFVRATHRFRRKTKWLFGC